METLKEKLTNPFDGLNGDPHEFQKKCAEIAKDLFKNYCIECGAIKYYFAEIEFYYYEKDKWDKDWNNMTYARNEIDPCAIYYHLSGMDICFKSYYDESKARFGGILIRAVKKEDGDIIAGPYSCRDELLNVCKGHYMPRLSKINGKCNNVPNVLPALRCLGDKDKSLQIKLCFYDGNVRKEDWNPKRMVFNTKKGEIVPKYGAYKTNRFDY